MDNDQNRASWRRSKRGRPKLATDIVPLPASPGFPKEAHAEGLAIIKSKKDEITLLSQTIQNLLIDFERKNGLAVLGIGLVRTGNASPGTVRLEGVKVGAAWNPKKGEYEKGESDQNDPSEGD